MRNKTWGLITLFIGMGFFACHKTGDAALEKVNTPASEVEIAAIKNWLSIQPSANGNFVNTIDWSSTDRTSYQNGSTLVTVLLNSKTTARRVGDYIVGVDRFTTEYLVILMDSSGIILQGTLGQITPLAVQTIAQPSVLIKNILNKEPVGFNGAFTMMTLSSIFMYQLQYADYARTKEITMRSIIKSQSGQIKSNSITASNITKVLNDSEKKASGDENCWTWYLFVFDQYGNLVDAIFLGVECDTPCAEASIGPDGKVGTVKVNCIVTGTSSGTYDIGNLCSATPPQAAAALSQIYSTMSSDEPEISFGTEYAAPITDYPFAIKRPAIPVWPIESVTFSSAYVADYVATYAGIVVKREPNVQADPWRWESLAFSNIQQAGGHTPPCLTLSWTATSSVAFGADNTMAYVDIVYTGQAVASCLLNSQWKNVIHRSRQKNFKAKPD